MVSGYVACNLEVFKIMTPTEQELRELDRWISINIFGNLYDHPEDNSFVSFDTKTGTTLDTMWYGKLPHYTTDPAAAMIVLERCVKESPPTIFYHEETWSLESPIAFSNGSTLPLSICLFAKKLFGEKS